MAWLWHGGLHNCSWWSRLVICCGESGDRSGDLMWDSLVGEVGLGFFMGYDFFFGSDGGVEWLYVVCSGWVFCSGKQSVVKDFIFYFWKNWMDRFSLIPKLKQYNQEKNKGTRTLQDNPKNQHLRDVWNQHQAIKLRHQYLRCQHPTIWKIFHLKFH